MGQTRAARVARAGDKDGDDKGHQPPTQRHAVLTQQHHAVRLCAFPSSACAHKSPLKFSFLCEAIAKRARPIRVHLLRSAPCRHIVITHALKIPKDRWRLPLVLSPLTLPFSPHTPDGDPHAAIHRPFSLLPISRPLIPRTSDGCSQCRVSASPTTKRPVD